MNKVVTFYKIHELLLSFIRIIGFEMEPSYLFNMVSESMKSKMVFDQKGHQGHVEDPTLKKWIRPHKL